MLSHRTQQGREVDQPVNAMVHNDLLETLEVQDVGKNVGTILQYRLTGLYNVREDHVLAAILRPQEFGALDAQLAQAT